MTKKYCVQFSFENMQYLKRLNWATWSNYEKINFFDICVLICERKKSYNFSNRVNWVKMCLFPTFYFKTILTSENNIVN